MMIKAISILKQHVKLKRDSETVLNYLKAYSACLASFGNVIEDTRALSLQLRVRLNRLQTNFGNQFPENGAFGCDGKYYFPEMDFLLTEI